MKARVLLGSRREKSQPLERETTHAQQLSVGGTLDYYSESNALNFFKDRVSDLRRSVKHFQENNRTLLVEFKCSVSQYQSPPLDTTLNQFHTSSILTPYFPQIIVMLCPHPHLLLGLLSVRFPRGFLTKILYVFLVSPMLSAWPILASYISQF
jgi:hypothetical protein